jgi:hypothetical protein
MNDKFTDEDLIERIWAAIIEKQQSLNQQLENSLNKINQEREKGNRLIEESEKKYFRKIDRKNLEMKEMDTRILRRLEDNKLKNKNETKKEGKKRGGTFTKNKKKRNKSWKTPEEKTESRYEDYNYIYEAISDADFKDDEKQALMEVVSAVQHKFTKSAE